MIQILHKPFEALKPQFPKVDLSQEEQYGLPESIELLASDQDLG